MIRLLPAFALSAAALVCAPASAQDAAGDQVRMVIVYGDDAAPEPVGDEIVVVARKPEGERYRIPENLRASDSPANTSWAERVEQFELVGQFGTMSCDPAGAGGFTGCTQQFIDAAFKDRANGADVRFGQLIELARAQRLSNIDVDAAAEQARVEELERSYLDRLERERAAPVGDEVTDPSAPPAAITDADRQIPAEPARDTAFDDGDEVQVPLDASPLSNAGGE